MDGPFDDAALKAQMVAATACLAMASMTGPAAAAKPRYPDAVAFLRGTAQGLVAISGQPQASSAEEVAARCLAMIAGAQGTEAFGKAVVRELGTFALSTEQQAGFRSCIAQAGYQFRESPPVPPGSRRVY